MSTEALNPLAQKLNDELAELAPEVLSMLSAYGRRLYFPKGILSQSAEAKEKGKRFNATIGIATEKGGPMYLESLHEELGDIDPRDAYTYAPPAGRPGLRERWAEKIAAENPSLAGKSIGQPIVTAAITHGLSLVGELFLDPGDILLLPDKLWGNYRLTYEVRLGAKIQTYPFYTEGDSVARGFNIDAFEKGLADAAKGRDKVAVLLNFPNNPTGYMPTSDEVDAMVSVIEAQAKKGTKIVAISDDAYFGLFYHLGGESITESPFARFANLHPNVLGIKLDAATKELFVWGLRCGFITFGPGEAKHAERVNAVLDAKTRGAIRGGISNASQLSQTLVERALGKASLDADRKQKSETLRQRAAAVYEVTTQPKYAESWSVYPFNSGYFMCIGVKGVDAEELRLHLLDKYELGLIATSATDIRVAFSCLEEEDVEPLFEDVHKAIQELRKK